MGSDIAIHRLRGCDFASIRIKLKQWTLEVSHLDMRGPAEGRMRCSVRCFRENGSFGESYCWMECLFLLLEELRLESRKVQTTAGHGLQISYLRASSPACTCAWQLAYTNNFDISIFVYLCGRREAELDERSPRPRETEGT